MFKFALFAFLGYMVYIQLKEYFSNQDVSSLLYKKFQHHKEDIYPTFSVCIVSYNGRLFEEKLGNMTKLYWKYLRGKDESDENSFANLNYDDVVMDTKMLLNKYQRKTKTNDGKFTTEQFVEFEQVFQIIYQDPNEICFGKKERNEEGRLIKYDLVNINAKWVPSSDWSECHVYFHQKGQVIRTLTKPTINLFGKSLRNGKLKGNKGFKYIIRMRSNAMEVLRKRSDAVEGCNSTLLDDNNRWRESLIEQIQCVPTFMRRFVPVLSDLWPKCSPNQLQKLEDIYSPYDDFDAAGKHYLPPCTQTTSVVTSTENVELVENPNSTSLVLKFEYPIDYRETINKRAFIVYDLWSQIGGIMGIIVGYSLMQIPETFENIFIWTKNLHTSAKTKINV